MEDISDDFVKNFVDNYKKDLKAELDKVSYDKIAEIISLILKAGREGRKIFIAGNGGSSAIASHFYCDLAKTILKDKKDTDRLKVMCLSDNIPHITATSNDWGYEEVFVEPLKNHLEKDDVVFLISSGGSSPNIVNAAEYAKEKGALLIGLTGFSGGKLKQLSDYNIHVDSNEYGIVEDTHSMICHLIAFCIKAARN